MNVPCYLALRRTFVGGVCFFPARFTVGLGNREAMGLWNLSRKLATTTSPHSSLCSASSPDKLARKNSNLPPRKTLFAARCNKLLGLRTGAPLTGPNPIPHVGRLVASNPITVWSLRLTLSQPYFPCSAYSMFWIWEGSKAFPHQIFFLFFACSFYLGFSLSLFYFFILRPSFKFLNIFSIREHCWNREYFLNLWTFF